MKKNGAGFFTFSNCRRCAQRRSIARYQFRPPVKPVRAYSLTKNSISSSESHAQGSGGGCGSASR